MIAKIRPKKERGVTASTTAKEREMDAPKTAAKARGMAAPKTAATARGANAPKAAKAREMNAPATAKEREENASATAEAMEMNDSTDFAITKKLDKPVATFSFAKTVGTYLIATAAKTRHRSAR